jgi:hypothetical protein
MVRRIITLLAGGLLALTLLGVAPVAAGTMRMLRQHTAKVIT